MRIAFFSSYYLPYRSGLTVFPAKILTHLAKQHSVRVLTFKSDHSLPSTQTDNGVEITRLPYLTRFSKGFISPQSLSSFWRLVRWADQIIINLPNGEGLPLVLMAKGAKKKVITLFHCDVHLQPGFIHSGIETTLRTIVKSQLRLSSQIIATTYDYISHLSWYDQSLKDKTQVVFPLIDQFPVDAAFSHQLATQKKDHMWIGFVGRTAREKGLEYLIQALTQLRHKLPLTLVLAGPVGKQVAGEAAYYHQLFNQLKQSKLPYHIFGDLSQSQLGALYRTIDTLVLPSINQTEAFGMVQVESMFLGTPVITSDLPGVRIPIQQTGMGLIVPPKDVPALSQAVSQIIAHRSHYTSPLLVAKAQAIFNPNQVYDFYDQLFHD